MTIRAENIMIRGLCVISNDNGFDALSWHQLPSYSNPFTKYPIVAVDKPVMMMGYGEVIVLSRLESRRAWRRQHGINQYSNSERCQVAYLNRSLSDKSIDDTSRLRQYRSTQDVDPVVSECIVC
jgi:hypothetical protein